MTTITTLKLDYDNNGRIFTVYPTLIFDEHEMVMIDCGYPGHLPKIQELALMQGIDLKRLTKIIVTHNDIDHMGALGAFKREYPHIEIIASHLQAQYISGEQTTIRLQLAQHAYKQAQPHRRSALKKLIDILTSVETVSVDQRVSDQQVIDAVGGLKIIYTPGHLPGHISVYHMESRSLIAGDALVSEFGKLEIAHQKSNLDSDLARKSARSLAQLDIQAVYCYHGGKYTGNIKEELNSL
ncbi:MAG: MBL fold metallo-hydrolase [Firmicutes bacterium HGW-Firmicutes-19]|jgi:glyoxylase-like metal-dependent hydrolase (beta-lactamase superfamily II)|nr:MAG: MBL fold metallo-hydrolase [Firmicutes bacterium HGW-Firmicutes-19]